jgi:predicted ATP-dependent endonuclease of OLD family
LLIEEPEAHIHTHIQKTLFEKYGYKQTQVVVSTHSTHISAASKIRSVNILSKLPQDAQVYHPSAGLNEDECRRIERYLDAVRSTLLFAKGVMLVEGDAELILVPSLVKEVFGISLDELGVSLIGMSAAVFRNVATVFHDDRVHRRCSIITDLDSSIVELPANADDDDDFQKKCRDSQKSGEQRKEQLDEFCNDNVWVEPFYAEHTFEVDFLLCDNASTVAATLTSVYRRQANRVASKSKLENEDVAVSGREILRLAKKKGKGWFALLLSEHLSVATSIPEYILRALAHSSKDTIDDRSLKLMGLFRIRSASGTGLDAADLIPEIDNLAKLSPDEFISRYIDELPSDPLTEFIGYLDGEDDAD